MTPVLMIVPPIDVFVNYRCYATMRRTTSTEFVTFELLDWEG